MSVAIYEHFFADLSQKGIDGFKFKETLWPPKAIPAEIYDSAISKVPLDGNKYELIGFKVELVRHETPFICMYHVMPYKMDFIERALAKNDYDAFVSKEISDDLKEKICVLLMREGLFKIMNNINPNHGNLGR